MAKSTMKSYEELPLMMTAKDITALGFGRNVAYQFMNRRDFPVIIIGTRKFVRRDRFFEWLDKQTETREEAVL